MRAEVATSSSLAWATSTCRRAWLALGRSLTCVCGGPGLEHEVLALLLVEVPEAGPDGAPGQGLLARAGLDVLGAQPRACRGGGDPRVLSAHGREPAQGLAQHLRDVLRALNVGLA